MLVSEEVHQVSTLKLKHWFKNHPSIKLKQVSDKLFQMSLVCSSD
jgi:hypothetical protein